MNDDFPNELTGYQILLNKYLVYIHQYVCVGSTKRRNLELKTKKKNLNAREMTEMTWEFLTMILISAI